MAGSTFGDRLTRYVSATATARTVPDTAPEIPEGMLETISTIVSPDEAPFLSHLARVRVEWLEMEADRLGNTCFEMRPHEIEARKRQHLPPGPVTIGLHPILAEDHLLFSHTLAHELLHAAGMTEHDDRHTDLVNAIAPSPKLSESPLLQDIRNQALNQQEVKDWTCGHCEFVWARITVKAPSRCPKCARPFK
jgi:predicted Zn-ribbon and HTH transcriptional regulator